jgi:trk system potassium uptake protein
MRIVVIGAGEVGYHIAERLGHERRHDITVIERNPAVCQRVEETLDLMVIQADGSSPRALEEAGIRDAELVIAVADVDEVNIVACAVANQYGVPRKIARVRNLELGEHPILAGGKVLGIDLLINPNHITADEIIRLIHAPAAAEVADFADGRVQLLGAKIAPGAPIANRLLRELRTVSTTPFLVVGITRGNELLVPTGDTRIGPEDHLYVVTRREHAGAVLHLLGRAGRASRRIFIIGGGRIGATVAEALEQEATSLTVLERNPARCQFLAQRLERALVLHGDGTDVRLLIDEGISEADAVVTITDDDATNLLAALLGKHYGARKAVALLKRQDLIPLVEPLGVDAAISPRLLTASVILRYVRRGRVLSVFELPEGDAETLEVVLAPETPATGRVLKDLGMPKDSLVGAIVRGDDVIIPTGGTVLQVGDRVVLLALPAAIPGIERLFG